MLSRIQLKIVEFFFFVNTANQENKYKNKKLFNNLLNHGFLKKKSKKNLQTANKTC